MEEREIKVTKARDDGSCEHCGALTFDSIIPQKTTDSLTEIWIGKVHSPRIMTLCDDCLNELFSELKEYINDTRRTK